MQNRISVFLLTFSIIIALMLPVSASLPSHADLGLYDGIIRLHVLANSDTDADQALKLAVRDGILEIVSELLSDVSDRDAAERILSENLTAIENRAADVLTENGSDYSVCVTLTKEAYPTRVYGDITLPAGTYTSLRVLIGEAEGQNWWCVLFPKLCVTGQSIRTDTNALIEAGLTPSQVRIITGNSPDVVIKFRFLEFFSRIFS